MAPRIRGLATVGLIALIAQDASVVAVMVLANGQEGQGALVLYNFGWQVFFVPYAVLAVPIATTAFPVLASAEGARFDDTAAASTRAVMLVSWLGAALLAGAAVPASRLFTHHPADARQLAYTFAAFAPGLIGYGLSTNLSRVLFADARTRVAAAALVAGWLLVIAADVVAVRLVPDWWVVPVLGLGNTIGLTVSGLALLGAVRRARGGAALRGRAARGPGRAGRGRDRGGRGGRAVLRRARPRVLPQRWARGPGLRVRDARVRGRGAGPGRGGPAGGAGPRPGHAAGTAAGRAEAASVSGPCVSEAGTGAQGPERQLPGRRDGRGHRPARGDAGRRRAPPGAPWCTSTARPIPPSPRFTAPRPGWDFTMVDIADRPRPARDAAAVLRLRGSCWPATPPTCCTRTGSGRARWRALALALPRRAGTALVVTVHNAPPAGGRAAAVYAVLELIVARRADAVLTVSGGPGRPAAAARGPAGRARARARAGHGRGLTRRDSGGPQRGGRPRASGRAGLRTGSSWWA